MAMNIVCLDLEGVLVPEIWIAFAEASGIPELKKTTRDEPDYDKLMTWRLGILKEHGLGLNEIQETIAKIDQIPGAKEFLDELRSLTQVIIISDTFAQFATPLMQTWIGTDYQFVTNSLFYALLPILAALPYAGTYYEDIKTGYLKNILLHTSRRGYYMAKSFVVFVMAAITVMIPLLLDLMAVMTIYPLRMPERLEFLSAGILDVNLFSGLYETNGALYALAFILLDGLFAGLLALVSVCVAERVESMFSAIVIPFAFYIMWSTVMMENNDGRFSVMEMLNPRQSVVFSRLQVVLMAVGGTLIIILWLFLKGRRKDVL